MWQIWILYLGFPALIGLIDDMEERGEIDWDWFKHSILYEKMILGEYRLYPKFIQKLTKKGTIFNDPRGYERVYGQPVYLTDYGCSFCGSTRKGFGYCETCGQWTDTVVQKLTNKTEDP